MRMRKQCVPGLSSGGGAWERSYVINCISALTIALIFLLNCLHLLDSLTLFTLA